jgi:hypothetical protein
MRPCLRYALLTVTTLLGLATVPTRGADAELERPKPLVEMTTAEWWRLRPAHAVAVVPPAMAPRTRVAAPIPEERRNVRVVYPGLVEAR